MKYENCIRANGSECQAVYSDCLEYRFKLSIVWDRSRPLINFLMLNPSTATERKNDPTVEGCERRAREWGFGGLIVTNIFGIRATDPLEMRRHPKPVGQCNDFFILEAAREAEKVVCAWGNHGLHQLRGCQVCNMLRTYEVKPWILNLNKSGEPQHPLYVSRSIEPTRWTNLSEDLERILNYDVE